MRVHATGWAMGRPDEMKRQRSIESVLAKADEEIRQVKDRYPLAIQARATDEEFDILVNDCLHHLRQALDFVAHDIYDSYRTKPRRIYFPFADRRHTRATFERVLGGEWFPGLDVAKPKVFKFGVPISLMCR